MRSAACFLLFSICLFYAIPVQSSMTIFIRHIGGAFIILEGIDEDAKVEDIKKKIEEKRDLPFEDITLLCMTGPNGRRIENGQKLSDYGLKNGDSLYIMLIHKEGE